MQRRTTSKKGTTAKKGTEAKADNKADRKVFYSPTTSGYWNDSSVLNVGIKKDVGEKSTFYNVYLKINELDENRKFVKEGDKYRSAMFTLTADETVELSLALPLLDKGKFDIYKVNHVSKETNNGTELQLEKGENGELIISINIIENANIVEEYIHILGGQREISGYKFTDEENYDVIKLSYNYLYQKFKMEINNAVSMATSLTSGCVEATNAFRSTGGNGGRVNDPKLSGKRGKTVTTSLEEIEEEEIDEADVEDISAAINDIFEDEE